MSLFSKLFGNSDTPKTVEPEIHDGFRIYPEPIREGSNYRLSARVEKEIGGAVKSHHLIRADTFGSAEDASAAAIAKAKQLIDQMGERLF